MTEPALNGTAQKGVSDPIAIVGMGCRLAGGARDLPGLWKFLREQRDGFMEYAEPRFTKKAFYHPNVDRPGTTVATGGFLMDEDPRLFDPAFFGITDLEAETLDPSQRKLLEVTYEAFEGAGDTWESVSGSRIGVFVGDISYDNYISQTRDWDYAGRYSATGAFPNMLSNRIHYVFNLCGPSACTSAMYALHLAVNAIHNGDCDSAIVAGSNWIMDPNMHMSLGKLGALSPSSRSHTFDASADGYARGEGFAALYLKTASQAVKDGSPIRALVMGTAVNANGRTNGITNPSGIAQEVVIRKAYENAGGLDPSETPFLECHGTGTRVGDPIEVQTASKIFTSAIEDAPDVRLMVGSVKTNLGHLEGACALPGILKVVAALEAGEIPPSLGVKTLNPRVDFEKAKIEVVTDVIPWPEDRLRRASVTSAGFGGTNGHCVLDHVNNLMPHYVKPGVVTGVIGNGIVNGSNGSTNGNGLGNRHSPVIGAPSLTMRADAGTRQLVLLPFSAHSEASLKANIDVLSRVLPEHSLADVAYTLAAKRSRFAQRTFRIVDKHQIAQGLHQDGDQKPFSAPSQQARIGFAFTGQGAQWHAMGAELFEYGVFRASIEYLDRVLGMLPEPPSWKIADALSGNCDEKFVQTAAVSQTVCTALQVGLVDLLASWSVRPAGVVGHSSGEMAAAYAAGRITAAEAITIAYYRGYIVSSNKQNGAMLAVGLAPDQAAKYLSGLENEVRIAAINSPDSVTLSGNADAVEAIAAKINQDGVFNRLLRTGGLAYHSHHMAPLGPDYAKAISDGLRRLKELGAYDEALTYSSVPWISSVDPDIPTGPKQVTTSYWRANLESTIRFSEAAAKLLSLEGLSIGALVEIGPHPALKSPVGQIVKSAGMTVPHIASLKRAEDGRRSVLSLAGTLFGINAGVDLVAVNAVEDHHGGPAHGCTAVDLPPYQYTYGPINYHESRLSKEYRYRKAPRHDLLGSKIVGTTKLRPQWRNLICVKDLPWLDDHRVPPYVLLPGAAHIVNAMVAAEHWYREFPDALPITGFTLRNVSIKKTLVVPQDDHGIEIVLSMEFEDGASAKAPGWASFSIASVVRDSDQWTEHCSGHVKVEVAPFKTPPAIDTASMDGRPVEACAWYSRFAELGLKFGPSFEGYSDINADPDKRVASAKIALKTTEGMFPGGESSYPLHPASLDLVVRLGLIACSGGQAELASVQLPIHMTQMRLKLGHHQPQDDWAIALGRGEQRGMRGCYAQLQMLDRSGDVALDIDNLRFTSLNNEAQTSDAGQTSKAFASPFARMVWRPDIRTLTNERYRALFPQSEGGASQVARVFDLLGHVNAHLRVLEVKKGGDVGATREILKVLVGTNGIKRYRDYVVTDLSEDLAASIREYTSEFRDVSCSVLDIEKDPQKQGYQPTYDVVLASSTLDDSANVQQTLGNCKKLLRPGGKLVLLVKPSHSSSVDGALRSAGFTSGAELMLDDPKHDSTVIVSTLSDPDTNREVPNGTGHTSTPLVHLLHGSKGAPALLKSLAEEMEGRSLSVRISPLDSAKDIVTPDSRVVAFLDGENLLLSADEHRLGLFQHLAHNAASMVWITSCGMVKGRNPDGSFVGGLLRGLGSENPAGQFLFVDVDAADFVIPGHEVGALVRILADQELLLQEQLRSDGDGEGEVNREFAWQEGCMWVSRIVPDGELQGYVETSRNAAAPDDHDMELVALGKLKGPVRAAFGTPGILSSLYFRAYTELQQPLPRDWIEVKVDAVGLNWKDLGLCSGRFDGNNLSSEYCGVVTAKGPKVTGLEVGDRVYGMGKGHFGNYTHVPAATAQKMRDGDNPLEMATMPLVYMTAVYAFEHVTRVRKGHKVLIQSATGGLGIAAIQLARAKGAEVFATAGTPDKVRFLTQEMNIPATHVFSSREPADLLRMVEATQHEGFDVILSNASGDMLYESLKALAPLGHLVDVGRMDVNSAKNIALDLFQKSAGFTSFDLNLVVERDPVLGGELLKAVDEHYRAGRIGSIRPASVSDVSQLDQVLLRFSKGTHIGKLVISYQNPEAAVKMHRSTLPAGRFDPEARYIITGGLSGLGRSIIRWMCDRGARDFVILSRRGKSGAGKEVLDLIDSLAARDISLQPVACDVSNQEQVMSVIKDASSDRQVRGVLHFAVSYEDISFDKMSAERLREGMAAKVHGTKNLHEATASLALDFFVMASTVGTIYAFPTQTTYAASSNFLDYFARHRRSLGLPASTLSLGYIVDVGTLTAGTITYNLFTRAKGQTITASQFLRLLEPVILNSHDQAAATAQPWIGRDQDPLSEANVITCIDPAALARQKREETNKTSGTSSGSMPRWYRDPRVSLVMRALDDAWRHYSGEDAAMVQDMAETGEKSAAALLRHQFQLAVKKIRETGSEDDEAAARAFVADAVMVSVAAMLFVDKAELNPANTVADHGVDSLLRPSSATGCTPRSGRT
ncbi:hypothetical protein DL771_011537 [Monosporascus sp. 5C6A]|nr:hypothetical protein DL771_011537 [Monosporascus sp. 5C6A]